MQLEESVVSLDVARKLKDLGVKQESEYYWKNYGLTAYDWRKEKEFYLTDETYDREEDNYNQYTRKRKPDMEIYSAFSVAELGVLLPEWCSSSRNYDGTWDAYPCAAYGDVPPVIAAPTEADARGILLAAIIEKYTDYLSDCTASPLFDRRTDPAS